MSVVWTIAEELATNQLLVVGLSRPGTDLDGPWFDEYPFAERITLDPLDRATSETLVHEVLQRVDHVPDSIVDLIVDRSDGNPFFVEEIVKMLRDNGVIIDADADADADAHDGGWSIVPDRLDPSDVPTTISGVLQARLDQLGADERSVLQHAAVMGRTFWDDAVASMMARPMPARPFATAVQRELVFPLEHSSFDGSQEFVFKHALLREVAYETVLLRDRAALHARAAEWLTERAGDRVHEYLDTIADHHRHAAQHDEAARVAVPRRHRGVRTRPRPGRSRQAARRRWTSGSWPTCRCRSRHSSCSARCSAVRAIPTRRNGRCAPRSTASAPTIPSGEPRRCTSWPRSPSTARRRPTRSPSSRRPSNW